MCCLYTVYRYLFFVPRAAARDRFLPTLWQGPTIASRVLSAPPTHIIVCRSLALSFPFILSLSLPILKSVVWVVRVEIRRFSVHIRVSNSYIWWRVRGLLIATIAPGAIAVVVIVVTTITSTSCNTVRLLLHRVVLSLLLLVVRWRSTSTTPFVSITIRSWVRGCWVAAAWP